MPKATNSKVTVKLTEQETKKRVVRFKTDVEDAPMSSAYVANAAVKKLGGAPNGVKITIEAL